MSKHTFIKKNIKKKHVKGQILKNSWFKLNITFIYLK